MSRASQGEARGSEQHETQGWDPQGWRFLGGEGDTFQPHMKIAACVDTHAGVGTRMLTDPTALTAHGNTDLE